MYVHCMTSHRTLFLNVFCSQICLHIIGVGTGGGDWGHVPPKVFNICHAHIACTWSIVVYYALAMSATQPSSESEPLPLKKLKQSTLTTTQLDSQLSTSSTGHTDLKDTSIPHPDKQVIRMVCVDVYHPM